MTRPLNDFSSLLPEVRRALRYLYDPVYLQRSPLTALLYGRSVPPGQEVRVLRQVIVEIVEQLAPLEGVSVRSERRRAYEMLRGRYIDGLSVGELARQMNLSERQVRRDLRLALEALTQMIYGLLQEAEAQQGPDNEGKPPIEQALATLTGEQVVNLCEEVRNVQALLRTLASQRGVRLIENDLPESLLVRANRVILRQILVGLYTRILQGSEKGVVSVRAFRYEGDQVALELRCEGPTCKRVEAGMIYPELCQAIKATLESSDRDGAQTQRLLLAGFPSSIVLLVDDNPSLHQLFRRYLIGLPYTLLSAYSAAEGYRLARQQKPRLILLDIMMPHRDGWEMLRLLQEDERTRSIPVVICSVLAEEALASSLSVAGYLRKPVSQSQLLSVLTTFLPVRSA